MRNMQKVGKIGCMETIDGHEEFSIEEVEAIVCYVRAYVETDDGAYQLAYNRMLATFESINLGSRIAKEVRIVADGAIIEEKP